jgi:hypothetical protein
MKENLIFYFLLVGEKISTHFQKLDARKKILHRGCQGMTQKSHGYIALLILLSNFFWNLLHSNVVAPK